MNSGSVRRGAVVAANRIPFARSNTAYADASNQEMLTATLRTLVEKTGLGGERLGEVAGGAIMKHARDWNLVRECVLSSGLAPSTPAFRRPARRSKAAPPRARRVSRPPRVPASTRVGNADLSEPRLPSQSWSEIRRQNRRKDR